jgi:hypothetical protein
LILFLAVLLTGVAALGAQEGPPPPPPPPEGLAFSGSVITGLRYRNNVQIDPAVIDNTGVVTTPAKFGDRFDVDATDDYLSAGDTAQLRGALNKGFYGLNFGLALNANNTQDGFWVVDQMYVNEASLWAKFLDNKIGVKAGYYADFDYFTPVQAYSLGASSAVQLTVFPIAGLQIDVKSRLSPFNNVFGTWAAPVWYDGEEWARNVDVGVKYVAPNFTVFAAFDNDYSLVPPPGRASEQIDVFGYFGWTGTPKLTATVDGKFFDLTSEVKDAAGDAVGITIATALNVGYQISDALSARAWFIAGSVPIGGSIMAAKPLLGEDGFTFGVNAEVSYKLNDKFTFFLTPVFQIPDTEKADIFDISVRPKMAWALATGPYAATINFSYTLRVYGKDGEAWSSNNEEALLHIAAVTFGWNF